jgi:dihydrofolate synthase / folylpolyglutamate synthase
MTNESAATDFDPIAYINEPRWQASRLGLDRIRELLERLGRPQDRLRFVHVAGTNGKGSTCAFIANVLQAAGYRTGWFSSPYIEVFEERIRVNGANISLDDLTRVTLQVRKQAEAMAAESGDHPTEFELMTAVALLHFAQAGCQVVVLEVGLGGRLDSTNVIEAPDVTVICRIGLDHTAMLGNTVAQVAAEKAGIIKQGSAVVSWPQEPDAAAVVRDAAQAAGDTLTCADFSQLEIQPVVRRASNQLAEGEVAAVRPFTYKGKQFETALLGTYQPQNAAVALETIDALRARGWEISDAAVIDGVAATRWAGRFEVLPHIPNKPTIVIDGGHNPQGAQVLADSLDDVFAGEKVVLLSGVMADKNYVAMLETVLPCACGFVAVTPDNPRALPADEYAAAARSVAAKLPTAPATENIQAAETYAEATTAAQRLAGPSGIICAFGSLYSIHETKEALRGAGLLAD